MLHCTSPIPLRRTLQERLKAELGRGTSIAHELDLYAKLPRHPHLVACLGHFWSGAAVHSAGRIGGRDDRSRDTVRGGTARLVLVLEHAPLGDLHEFLHSRRSAGAAGLLDEASIWSLFAQIAAAACHLHAHSIVHRDLKALNVVLCGGDSERRCGPFTHPHLPGCVFYSQAKWSAATSHSHVLPVFY